MSDVTARVRLSVSGEPVDLEMTMPQDSVDPVRLLPVLWQVEDRLIEVAVRRLAESGEQVSCRAGCGRCCRQLVPISRTEARQLSSMLEAMPEPRRSVIRGRVARGIQAVRDAGILDSADRLGSLGPDGNRSLGLAWFALDVACPFLEDESCSIHAERPLACREYLVSSPAENCARPSADTIRMVPLAGRLSRAAISLEPGMSSTIPLLLALDPGRAGPPPESPEPAPIVVRRVIERLAGAG